MRFAAICAEIKVIVIVMSKSASVISVQSDRNIEMWKMQENTLSMFAAEVVGTCILLLCGCMGNVGSLGSTPPPPLQTALTFGLTVNLVIMTIGHISGAHLNPAVTIGAVIMGLKSIPTGVIYILGQLVGAIIGYGLLKVVTPTELFNDGNPNSTVGVCVTVVHPGLSCVQGLLVEVFCTFCLLCAACATWDLRCAHITDSVALKFGFSVATLSFAAGPYTGCSMNPARSFAPAFWNSSWKDHWIYWVGPILGGLLGTFAYQVLFAESHLSRKKSSSNDKNSFNLSTQSNNIIM
ncbi:PREDICTED: aquaporin AQPAe.a-like [Wasmannia auropunctata]|uniref:aquaporin AQPAe.a-like n=1 Tax=Wasmannia auropunctata TaxID=64793 RepID=UPI0005EE891C|nr:PREDICTED: aquaporin AQPAe.a-like [Wasmannia auropunctata]